MHSVPRLYWTSFLLKFKHSLEDVRHPCVRKFRLRSTLSREDGEDQTSVISPPAQNPSRSFGSSCFSDAAAAPGYSGRLRRPPERRRFSPSRATAHISQSGLLLLSQLIFPRTWHCRAALILPS